MIVVTNIEYLVGDFARFEFEGLKADKKPTGKYIEKQIATGSKFVEWDSGKLYRYEQASKTWTLFGGGV